MTKIRTCDNLHQPSRNGIKGVTKIIVWQNKHHGMARGVDPTFRKIKDMISVTGVTNNYVLQPALLDKHTKTLAWLSATALWKSELAFFQKQLDGLSALRLTREERSEVTHFQNLVLFYNVEVIEDMRKKLRNHESKLARMLETKSEWETQYYKEHGDLMQEAGALSERFENLKVDLRTAIAKLGTENAEAY